MSTHSPLPWRAGWEDGSAPTTIMTVAMSRKTSKVGIRIESGHTKGRNFVSLIRDDTVEPLDFGDSPDTICEMSSNDVTEEVQVANAAFIVRAVNSYESMLAALQLVRTRAQQRQADRGILWDAITESAVTAAIKKVREV